MVAQGNTKATKVEMAKWSTTIKVKPITEAMLKGKSFYGKSIDPKGRIAYKKFIMNFPKILMKNLLVNQDGTLTKKDVKFRAAIGEGGVLEFGNKKTKAEFYLTSKNNDKWGIQYKKVVYGKDKTFVLIGDCNWFPFKPEGFPKDF
jgi:hypothetical protein